MFFVFCILESFNSIISHQLFGYIITFVNLQHENTNSKGDFVRKNRFKMFVLKISGIQNKTVKNIYCFFEKKRMFVTY